MRIKRLAFSLLVTFAALHAQRSERVTVFVRSDAEKILTKSNLDRIKKFILSQGLTITYCNMYNNNPTFRTTNFAFYLNPDGGQSNINCDPMKGDFNTLVIRRNPPGRMTDEEFQDQYRNINFFNEFSIRLEAHDLNPKAPVSQIRELSERAVIELLQVITERP